MNSRGMRRTLRRARRGMTEARVFAVVVVVAAIVAGTAYVMRPETPAPAPASSSPTPAVRDLSETPELNRRSLAQAMKLLEKKDRPFTVAVFGDSTGVSMYGWQVLVTRWMSETYDRPATLHPWARDPENEERSRYLDSWGEGEGSNAPLTVWNASAASTNATYPVDQFGRLVPVPRKSVDLVFVNYGHNEYAGTTPVHLMTQVAMRFPNASVVGIRQNPERTKTPHAEVQEANDKRFVIQCEIEEFDCLDAHTPFIEAGNYNRLLDGALHPTPEGYQLWADAMIRDLKAAAAS